MATLHAPVYHKLEGVLFLFLRLFHHTLCLRRKGRSRKRRRERRRKETVDLMLVLLASLLRLTKITITFMNSIYHLIEL